MSSARYEFSKNPYIEGDIQPIIFNVLQVKFLWQVWKNVCKNPIKNMYIAFDLHLLFVTVHWCVANASTHMGYYGDKVVKRYLRYFVVLLQRM